MRILLSLFGLAFGAPNAIAEQARIEAIPTVSAPYANAAHAHALIEAIPVDFGMCYGGYLPDPKWVAESSVLWNSETSRLPLTPDLAKQSAVAAFHKRMADYMPMTVETGNVRLNQIGDHWCYTIVLSFHRSDIISIGTPFWACVHVRLDGVARVEDTPLVTPEPAGLLQDQDKKKKSEQAGTGQPATLSQSKSEGRDKPQPESEGRSR